MVRVTDIHSIDQVAKMTGESLELIEIISWNSDDIDGGEMVHVLNEIDESLTTFTDRGVECLQAFLADVRTWAGGIRNFLLDEQCDPDVIERIMAYEKRSETRRPSAKAYSSAALSVS
jgi:hypothetical protein